MLPINIGLVQKTALGRYTTMHLLLYLLKRFLMFGPYWKTKEETYGWVPMAMAYLK